MKIQTKNAFARDWDKLLTCNKKLVFGLAQGRIHLSVFYYYKWLIKTNIDNRAYFQQNFRIYPAYPSPRSNRAARGDAQ